MYTNIVYMYIYIYVYMYVYSFFIYIYIYVCIYIYIYSYVYIGETHLATLEGVQGLAGVGAPREGLDPVVELPRRVDPDPCNRSNWGFISARDCWLQGQHDPVLGLPAIGAIGALFD